MSYLRAAGPTLVGFLQKLIILFCLIRALRRMLYLLQKHASACPSRTHRTFIDLPSN